MNEFHRMRPERIARARAERSVAYLPLGILEWHGLHNPYGLDGLKAEGFAKRLAGEIGGVVMPTLYYGDNRAEICERHLDRDVPRATVQWSPYHPAPEGAPTFNPAEAMGAALAVPRDGFARDAERSKARGGWRLWKELVVHTLFQIETYGFEAIVAIPGHYPLREPLEEAKAQYAEEGGRCLVLTLDDAEFSDDGKGDHAAAYETSLLLATAPETVDLAALDPEPSAPLAGVALGEDPREKASAAYGERALAAAVRAMRERLDRH
ncbi:creatininase family protein [Paenibacillus sp.]|uniref:creatininase family protein n=1 Tax=Paenibacillus sp. TaxID=58172 RepID=UPI002D402127|nr:creatininase family protein [Paenibacillus sp.]HZG56812.1 creatininase family protein [Paenibacillus sp.]